MTTDLYKKKVRFCSSVLQSSDFNYRFAADEGDDKRYICIRVLISGKIDRSFFRMMERHYMFLYCVQPLYALASNVLIFFVYMPTHRKEFIDMINNIAITSKKLLS